MRLLVCGGRDYADRDRVYWTLDLIHGAYPIAVVIQGAARGADTLAHDWSVARGVPGWSFPADWEAHGRAAGPLRNVQMLVEARPQLVLAFPGGRGTADMVRRARAAGIPVLDPHRLDMRLVANAFGSPQPQAPEPLPAGPPAGSPAGGPSPAGA